MNATLYEFTTAAWPPPDDRKDPRFYLFGFDENGQPYIVKWSQRGTSEAWLASSLDDLPHDPAQPVVHALIDSNADKMKRWADAPLRRSVLQRDGPDKAGGTE